MARPRRHPAVAGIDPEALAAFQAGIRRATATRRSSPSSAPPSGSGARRRCASSRPTRRRPCTRRRSSRTSAAGTRRSARPASSRAASRRARSCSAAARARRAARPHADGARPRRAPGAMPSKSLYWHTFGSLTTALREAGFDVPVGEERLERAVEQGAALARRLGRLPKFADWTRRAAGDASLLTEWQVYRMFERAAALVDVPVPRAGAAVEEGVRSRRTGAAARGYARRPRAAIAARRAGTTRPRAGRGRPAAATPRRTRSGWNARRRRRAPSLERAARALGHLALRELSRGSARSARACAPWRRRRSRLPAVPSQSGRPTPRATKRTSGRRSSIQAVAIEPCSCSSASGARPPPRRARRSPRSRRSSPAAARSKPWRAKSSSSFRMIPLWIPTTAPCRIGWLFASIVGWPFV